VVCEFVGVVQIRLFCAHAITILFFVFVFSSVFSENKKEFRKIIILISQPSI